MRTTLATSIRLEKKTVCILSLECIVKLVAVFLTFVGTLLLKKFVFIDIAVVSFSLEELFVEFVCSMSCNLFLLVIPLCRPLVTRWRVWKSSVFAAGLDHL